MLQSQRETKTKESENPSNSHLPTTLSKAPIQQTSPKKSIGSRSKTISTVIN
jgi:hypothetical protein